MLDNDTDAYIIVWAVLLSTIIVPPPHPHPQFQHLWIYLIRRQNNQNLNRQILYIFPLTATYCSGQPCHLSSHSLA